MRFRSIIGSEVWINIFAAGVLALDFFMNPRPDLFDKLFLFIWAFIVLAPFISQIVVYWDITPEGLRERRFWRIRFTPWSDVVHVVDHGPVRWVGGKTGSIEVEFPGPNPKSRNRRILVRTKSRCEFLSAVRTYTPQAVFEDAQSARDSVPAA